MNVIDTYKNMSVEDIRLDVQRNVFPYSALMQHINGDFNISTFIRNANAFGVKEVFYIGKKKWDRRGAVGTHNYTQLTHLSCLEDLQALKPNHRLVAVETNIPEAEDVCDFVPQKNDVFLFGEETSGLTKDILEICDAAVFIKQWGSVRSLNVGTASGVFFHRVSSFFENQRAN